MSDEMGKTPQPNANELHKPGEGLPAPSGGGATPAPSASQKKKQEEKNINHVVIRPLPDIVFLYPSCIAGFACAIWQYFIGDTSAWPGLIFMAILWVNYLILAFDFSRASTLAIILGGTAVAIAALYIGERFEVQILKALLDLVKSMNIQANSAFYLAYSVFLIFIYILVYIRTRFDYWVVTHNELLHYHGILGDVERYPAPNLRVTKEIDDIFEFLLLQSGKLIITPASEVRAFELDNVPRVNRIEKALNQLLSQIRVELAR